MWLSEVGAAHCPTCMCSVHEATGVPECESCGAWLTGTAPSPRPGFGRGHYCTPCTRYVDSVRDFEADYDDKDELVDIWACMVQDKAKAEGMRASLWVA